jgi:hypothetical protein
MSVLLSLLASTFAALTWTAPAVAVGPSRAALQGLANLENAFYPLLVGAIALLVIFDYAS